MTTCPACHHELQENLLECPFCGVIIAKWKPHPKSAPSENVPPQQTPVTVSTLSKSCSRCGGTVSSEAVWCPHCGHPVGVKWTHPEMKLAETENALPQQTSKNFLVNLFSGRVSLEHAFWFFGVPFYVGYIIFVSYSFGITPEQPGFLAIAYLHVFWNVYLLLISVVIWRSATYHQESSVWATGAKVFAVWAGLTTLYLLIPISYNLMKFHSIFVPPISK